MKKVQIVCRTKREDKIFYTLHDGTKIFEMSEDDFQDAIKNGKLSSMQSEVLTITDYAKAFYKAVDTIVKEKHNRALKICYKNWENTVARDWVARVSLLCNKRITIVTFYETGQYMIEIGDVGGAIPTFTLRANRNDKIYKIEPTSAISYNDLATKVIEVALQRTGLFRNYIVEGASRK